MQNIPNHNITLGFFLVMFLFSTFLLGWLLLPFFSVLVLSAVLAGVFRPAYSRLNHHLPAALASALTCLGIFLIIFVPIALFIGILSREAFGLYQMARTADIGDQIRQIIQSSLVLEKLYHLLASFNIDLSGENLNQLITDAGRVIGLFIYQQASSVAANVLNFVVYAAFMLLVVFYLLIDGPALLDFAVDVSPLPAEQNRKLMQKFGDMAGAVLVGNGLGGLIQGFLGGVVFYLFDLKSPLMWGVIMALLAFLPIVGIGVVFVPTAIYLMLSGRLVAGIFFLIFYALLSSLIEYGFKPRLVGKRVKMHTLLVFLSIVGGLHLFGILGIIYGPLVVTGFLTLTDIYRSSYQKLVEPPSPGGI